ncbi:luciferin sulfotransferase-like isoform X2 [Planococcus citri]|uniref:luciferin sulfotransferase-like isoform X2 n=1 Tax=Planococcus citri TaxID=170843 RepID=UPI0031F7FC60
MSTVNMNSNIIEISPAPYDPDLEKAKAKTKKTNKPFGEIIVGPRHVMFPKPYAEWADKILNMEIRKDDIWIISIPRSGTTWTEEMVWLLCNNLNYDAAKGSILHKRFMYLELAAMMGDKKLADEFWTVDKVMNAESPRFIKTHVSLELLPKQLWTVKPKIIYVYRNPKDVVISQYHFVCMINGYEGTFEEWAEIFIRDECIYNPFWTHVLDFWEFQKTHDVLFLTYEKMKEDLVSVVHKVADYLGTSLTSEQAKKLTQHLDYNSMKHNAAVNQEKQLTAFKIVEKPEDANFIRKGCSGQWKEKMTPEMIVRFDNWSKQYIAGTDFNFYE